MVENRPLARRCSVCADQPGDPCRSVQAVAQYWRLSTGCGLRAGLRVGGEPWSSEHASMTPSIAAPKQRTGIAAIVMSNDALMGGRGDDDRLDDDRAYPAMLLDWHHAEHSVHGYLTAGYPCTSRPRFILGFLSLLLLRPCSAWDQCRATRLILMHGFAETSSRHWPVRVGGTSSSVSSCSW